MQSVLCTFFRNYSTPHAIASPTRAHKANSITCTGSERENQYKNGLAEGLAFHNAWVYLLFSGWGSH